MSLGNQHNDQNATFLLNDMGYGLCSDETQAIVHALEKLSGKGTEKVAKEYTYLKNFFEGIQN
jgi:hypothetical protein